MVIGITNHQRDISNTHIGCGKERCGIFHSDTSYVFYGRGAGLLLEKNTITRGAYTLHRGKLLHRYILVIGAADKMKRMIKGRLAFCGKGASLK